MTLYLASFLAMLALITWPNNPVAAPLRDSESIVYVGTFKRESSKGNLRVATEYELRQDGSAGSGGRRDETPLSCFAS
jgi:hypothetical protein